MALLLTQPSLAHVDVRPRLVEQGKEAILRVELPQLRAGPPPVELEVEGDGITLLAADLRGTAGAETLWNVLVRVDPLAPAGEVLLVLRARFADGEAVEVDSSVVVIPLKTDPGRSFPWLPVAAGTTLALAVAAAVLARSRRRGAW